jgi:hypothetical protein
MFKPNIKHFKRMLFNLAAIDFVVWKSWIHTPDSLTTPARIVIKVTGSICVNLQREEIHPAFVRVKNQASAINDAGGNESSGEDLTTDRFKFALLSVERKAEFARNQQRGSRNPRPPELLAFWRRYSA